MSWYRWIGGDLVLDLRVQPRAARDGFAGEMGDAMRLRITAPPVDGKANDHLVALLAELFGVAKGAVSIERGLRGRQKRVRIARPTRLPPQVAEGGRE